MAGIAFRNTKFFIARRKAGGDLGGKWEFPGGKAEEGESDEAALLREYEEEFGLAVEAGPFLASASFEHRGKVYRLNAYRIFFGGGEPGGNLRLTEHTEWRWASLDEIKALDFAGSDRALLPGLEAYFQQNPGLEDRKAGAGLS